MPLVFNKPRPPAGSGGFDVAASAQQYAQSKGYNTGGWQVMQEGTITYQNDVPGFMVKYIDSQGRTTTEWTPLLDSGGAPYSGPGVTNVPMQSGGGGGGAGALAGSPYYQQVLAATNSAAAADAAARRSAIQQALIGFGLVPEGFADKYGDVDALTRSLAEKNTTSGISTRARLLQARSDAIRQFSRQLSARGLRRSGAKGYGLRRRQLQFDQGYSDALSRLLGYTGSLYGQFAMNEYQRQLALINALNQASYNLSPPSSSPPGDSAPTKRPGDIPDYFYRPSALSGPTSPTRGPSSIYSGIGGSSTASRGGGYKAY